MNAPTKHAAVDPVAAGFSPERLNNITRFAQGEITLGHIPGATMLIQRRGQTAFHQTWGQRDAATRSPLHHDALFRIYSMTKPIVSLAAMMLVEEARLGLDEPVAQYIPEFVATKVGVENNGKLDLVPQTMPMSVQDLLRHTSGLTYGQFGEGLVKQIYLKSGLFVGDPDNAEFCRRLAALPLAWQPGKVWEYSHATDVLGRVVEVASGQSLGAFLDERILKPLGMNETSFYVTDASKHDRIAEPFESDREFGIGSFIGNPRVAHKFEGGGGGLVSTVADYARFAQMLLNGGALDGTTYVSAKTLAFMASDHIGASTGIVKGPLYLPGPGFGFGLGFSVRLDQGNAPYPGTVGEFNWSGVAGTYFWIDPKEEMFVIWMMQAPSQRQRIRTHLKSLVYGAMTA